MPDDGSVEPKHVTLNVFLTINWMCLTEKNSIIRRQLAYYMASMCSNTKQMFVMLADLFICGFNGSLSNPDNAAPLRLILNTVVESTPKGVLVA